MTTLADAIGQMIAAGMPDFPPGHPRVNAGKILRYGPKKKAWYRLEEIRAQSGAYVVVGAYGSWGEIPSTKIEVDWKGMAAEERERLQQLRQAAEQSEAKKRAERAQAAALRARAQWDAGRAGKAASVQTYLERKQVAAVKGLRFAADGTLLVPMIRYDVTEAQAQDPDYSGPRRLVGLQKIAPDGSKLFNKGMDKAGAMCRLGSAPKSGEPVFVVEGVATGLTVSTALEHRYAVFVAFDAGNLVPAAKILRGLYPAAAIVFCADDDAYVEAGLNRLLRENYHLQELVTPPMTGRVLPGEVRQGDAWKPAEIEVSADWSTDAAGVRGIVGAVRIGERLITITRENAGRVWAHKAAEAVGNASVVFPVFKDRPLPADPDTPKLTDFNDLQHAESLAAVRAQLEPELKRLQLSAEVRKVVQEEKARAKTGEKKKRDVPPSNFDWDAFFERFTLIYPTDTVYDAKLAVIAKLSHVKIAFGDGIVKWWLESPRRRTVNAEHVVFDPACKSDPSTTINLFRGLPAPPAQPTGSCEKLLALLQYLCGEEEQDQTPVTDWVLNWLAYPLQHLGAKMASAIVMHGQEEGTGKNLFFNAMRDIYGRYGSLITQTQLESPYNGWMSQRLFVIANEVISRQELRHHVGRLKNLITESPLPIEEKYLPMRYEDNHLNAVFLTNEYHALQISPWDRRYLVIKTPATKAPEYYLDVVAEVEAGGAQALHRFLLDRDLGAFDEHSKPLGTEAKETLIELGMASPQLFQRELHDGLLHPLGYGPCLSQDLYQVYVAWCHRNGFKNPRSSNLFSHEFKGMNGVSRKVERVLDPDTPLMDAANGDLARQRTIFEMGVRSESVSREEWLNEHIRAFRAAAKAYLQDEGLRRSPRSGDGAAKDDAKTY